MPPAEGALENHIPAWYIVMMIRPAGAYSLNKMLSLLVFHLSLFSPGAKLPPWIDMLDGVPKEAVTVTGYQYDQHGELLPVPPQFYNDRYLAPLPVHIESQSGERLASVQFLPWQDGGAILLKGKLPISALLVFLGADKLKRAGAVNLKDGQLSYVLPITQDDFGRMLGQFQKQSNMVVRPEEPNFIVKKIADEGSSSPFMARLMLAVFFQRDLVFPDPTARKDFDKAYEVILTALFGARAEMQEITKIWSNHVARVASGEAADVRGATIHIGESVDRDLQQRTDAFLTAATRALKQGMQGVALALGGNIGFLFQKPVHFARELATLRTSDAPLADYLEQVRLNWSERLVSARNDVEHNGWTLPGVGYTRDGSRVTAVEPLVGGLAVTEFVTVTFDRLACLVEEVTIHLLKRRFPGVVSLTELPLAGRPEERPERFRVTVAEGGMPPWVIAYHASRFEDT